MNGELLERHATQVELDRLKCVRELRDFFAEADASLPAFAWVDLVDGSATEPRPLEDHGDIPWDAVMSSSGVPPLTYIVRAVDFRSMVWNMTEFRLKVLDSPNFVWYSIPPENAPLLDLIGFDIFIHGLRLVDMSTDPACKGFWSKFRFAILHVPPSIANRLEGGPVLLHLLAAHIKADRHHVHVDILEDIVVEFLQREDLDPASFAAECYVEHWDGSGWCLTALGMCLRKKDVRRDCRSIGGPIQTIALAMLHRWADEVPSMMGPLNDLDDTALHHTLEPTRSVHASDKCPWEASLCELLATRMSVQQLCHRNREGLVALSYAEDFVANTGADWAHGIWVRVREVIKHNMFRALELPCATELSALADDLQDALASARQKGMATEHLTEVVDTIQREVHAKTT